MNDGHDMYWAALPALPDPKSGMDASFAEEAMRRVEAHDEFLRTSGLLGLWGACSEFYHQGVSKNFLESVGKEGEFVEVSLNHLRNILKHVVILTTSTPPTMVPRATSTRYEARRQVEDADGLLDYFFTEKGIEELVARSVEHAVSSSGEDFVSVTWDRNRGELLEVDDETGQPTFGGDVRVESHRSCDVVRDPSVPSWKDQDWAIVRTWENRWDLAALYPTAREEVLALPSKHEAFKDRKARPLIGSLVKEDSDQVAVYCFFHRSTPALPDGRVVRFVSDRVVLAEATFGEESIRPDELPVYRVAADDLPDAPYGYSPAFDLLGPQEGLNILHSTILTNQSALGVQTLVADRGANVEMNELANGLRVLMVNQGAAIKPLDLLKTPAELWKEGDALEQTMETLAGVNSVQRGQPEASLKSGAALALVQSQSLAYSAGLQRSWSKFIASVGTCLVRIFAAKASEPRIAAISGRGTRRVLREISGADVSMIDAVVVEAGDALTRTVSGRVNLAEHLLKVPGAVQNAEQLLTVLKTGKIEPLTQGTTRELDQVQAENEAILRGETPEIMATDDDRLHIREHKVAISDPDSRHDPEVLRAATNHIQRHIRNLRTKDPILAAVLGQPAAPGQPPQEPGTGGGVRPGELAAQPPPTPQASPGEPGRVDLPVAGPDGEPVSVGLPKNPLTGERAEVPGGGQ